MKRVYFIKPIGMNGPIKIGSSIRPAGRCSSLATWSPFPLEIVAELDGNQIIEARFHRLFIDSHERLEWFSWTPELQATIDSINAGTFDVASLPKYAGNIASLKSQIRDFSDLDLEYVSLLRDFQALDYREYGFYHGRRPDIGAFCKIVSDEKKREIIEGLRSFVTSAPVHGEAA